MYLFYMTYVLKVWLQSECHLFSFLYLFIQSKQGLYEGTKAQRTEDGRLLLFRPDQNAIRMRQGAERLCMRAPSVDQFVDAVKQIARANKRWVTLFFY